jgi:NADPH2:quinone reductase
MDHAIRIHEHGGPEVMLWEEIEESVPGPGEVRIRHTAIGLNFIDTYHRSGLYPVPSLPSGLGLEAVGIVEMVGAGVDAMHLGDRVGYVRTAPGAYATASVVAAKDLIPIPDEMDDKTAASILLKGLTAQYLLRQTYKLEAHHTILVHAAAGGVGLMLCAWANYIGASVIGTVSTPAKAELARAHGCTATILYSEEDFLEECRELTDGEGVDVVYDSVGKTTFLRSLQSLKPFGTMVAFGQSSGKPDPFDIGLLTKYGSLYLARPSVFTFLSERANMLDMAEELFEMVDSGVVSAEVHQNYALKDAAQAHEELEARLTTGSSILLP